MSLAERRDLAISMGEHVVIADPLEANVPAKIASIVTGMVCEADSIHDPDVLRHGGMDNSVFRFPRSACRPR